MKQREKDMYRLWENSLKSFSPLETRDGEYVEILSPGHRNAGPGPDYSGSILLIDGKVWTGEVEIHLTEQDWLRHGHQTDANFNNVLLHVCLSSGKSTPTELTKQRTLILNTGSTEKEFSEKSTTPSSTDFSLLERDQRCDIGLWMKENPSHIPSLLSDLETLGKERLFQKADSIRNRILTSSPSRALTGSLLESLGLHGNVDCMKRLNSSLTFRRLRRVLHTTDADKKQEAGELFLLHRAGLLQDHQKKLFPKMDPTWNLYQEKKRILMKQHDFPPPLHLNWDHSGTRPANSPWRRLAGFVAIYRRWFLQSDPLLLEQQLQHMLTSYQNNSGPRWKPLLQHFITDPDETKSMWTTRSKPDGILDNTHRLIGEHRAAVLWLNSILPYLLARTMKSPGRAGRQSILQFSRQEELPLGDHRIRRVKTRLFGNPEYDLPLTSFLEQGIHQLYKSYCRFGKSGCRKCPLKGNGNV